jgi:hypothetical protein
MRNTHYVRATIKPDMVGNDMALGTVIRHKDPSAEALLLAVMLDDAERRPRR